MKTPRDVLLQHHRSATSRLDAIRQKVINTKIKTPDREPQRQASAGFLREFLLPLRWHLAGMSTMWVIAAILSMDSGASTPQSAQNSARPVEVLAALVENRRQLAEMIDPLSEDAASTPQPFVPRRRSALQPSSIVV